MDLAVGHSGDEIASHPAMKRLASFTHTGRVAAVEVRPVSGSWQASDGAPTPAVGPAASCKPLAATPVCAHSPGALAHASSPCRLLPRLPTDQVADLGGGALQLLAASADGSVARLRMTVPTQPGSQPEEIQAGAASRVRLGGWEL